MSFLVKYQNEQLLSERYKVVFASIFANIVDLFVLPFGYLCNYGVDMIITVMKAGIERRSNRRRSLI